MGTCSAQEKASVEGWYNNYAAKYAGQPLDEDLEPEIQSIWTNIQAGNQRVKIVRFKYKKYAVAAAVATIIVGAGLFYFNGKQESEKPAMDAVATTDIAPGKVGATLTLANGKQIRLTDAHYGEIAKEAGVAITKSAGGHLVYEIDGSMAETNKTNILSTSNGETYQIKLPDGTLVWLNAASSLTYATALIKDGMRKVKLSGEAYFQVARDKTHPFIVQSNGQEVEVLGTHFNINAYEDEPAIATTLVEGSVKVTVGSLRQMLKPGEQAESRRGSIKVVPANMEKVTDWRNGEFYVNHINLKVAMRKIARWYDVEVIYNSSVPDDMQIGGWVSRNERLSSVLKSIEAAGIVHFKVDGRKIYVNK
ncbi:FecR family protein [Pedobacter psychroterrae]|uniref:FecR family protein n=2 Tax=Pedobacter psychroterrae TaxID=2530453 RepID=A0A4R0N9N6_9SPHI|nr:FecR family protein [Pedobacter psychroterrae]